MNQSSTQKKKSFSFPQLEILSFSAEDIITVSGFPSVIEDDEKSENMDTNGWT